MDRLQRCDETGLLFLAMSFGLLSTVAYQPMELRSGIIRIGLMLSSATSFPIVFHLARWERIRRVMGLVDTSGKSSWRLMDEKRLKREAMLFSYFLPGNGPIMKQVEGSEFKELLDSYGIMTSRGTSSQRDLKSGWYRARRLGREGVLLAEPVPSRGIFVGGGWGQDLGFYLAFGSHVLRGDEWILVNLLSGEIENARQIQEIRTGVTEAVQILNGLSGSPLGDIRQSSGADANSDSRERRAECTDRAIS